MFAQVIIDTKATSIDRPFTYKIPENLKEIIKVGNKVVVPFGKGNTEKEGFVVSFQETSEWPEASIKSIIKPVEGAASVDDKLLELAIWMRYRYGGTLFQSLSVVLPNKVKVEPRKIRQIVAIGTKDDLQTAYNLALRKKHYAKIRLLEALLEHPVLPSDVVTDRLHVTKPTLDALEVQELIEIRTLTTSVNGGGIEEIETKEQYQARLDQAHQALLLNEEQQAAVQNILTENKQVQLLYGITGSGKTEGYLRLIEKVLEKGQEVIVLIPEIALTYQTVMRFYERFGELVSVVHSRLSKGEKWERFERARNAEVKIMIGPRSALFTPFQNLGAIIIDEFHETSYQSDQVPKYNTIETAIELSTITKAKVVLGSATPTVDAFYKAQKGIYGLQKLTHRAVDGAVLPDVQIVDLREELKNKNRSIFSKALQKKIQERLQKNEQVMLFLNRRGYSGSVSCRNCGQPIQCPHCSVALNYHKNNKLQCHFCGFEINMVKFCPTCGSTLIGTFGIGTEKVEEMVQETFPGVRTLRMDADTTSGKDGHREILEKFMNHEADVLVGTQMIVKGHDFPLVTLVGILAADLSLNVPDYRSAERTFELLVQAEGRAGRGNRKGDCIVQTYNPEHYAIQSAAHQNFESFYETEILFRNQMHYPPCSVFFGVRFLGADAEKLYKTTKEITNIVKKEFQDGVYFLGPTEENAFKVKDQYRYIFYVKAQNEALLFTIKNRMEALLQMHQNHEKIFMTFEG